jgi:hypothetical protein
LAVILEAVILPSCGNNYVNYPQPILNSLSPNTIQALSSSFTLTLNGNQFSPSSLVRWTPPGSPNGASVPLPIIFQTNRVIVVQQVPAALIQTAGTAMVSVFTGQPGGGTSQSLDFIITPAPSPRPTITQISPSVTTAGPANQVPVVITGTGFVSESVVAVSGNGINTTNVTPFPVPTTSTTMQISIPTSFFQTAGTLQLMVLNPPPNGGTSNTATLEVDNPVPRITTVSPATVTAGTASPPTISIAGTGFVSQSKILINGAPRTTTASSAQLQTVLTSSDVLNGGTFQIQVQNPPPVSGNGISNILTFSVIPTLTQGLPVLVDVAFNGAQPVNGICGGLQNCENGTLGLTLNNAGPSVSSSGQFVAFASVSGDLFQHDSSTASEVFFRNTCLAQSNGCTPITTVISSDASGGPANGPSSEPTIDSNGLHAAFTSSATNLVNTVALDGSTPQIFWRTICTTSATCNSTNQTIQLASISADGLAPGNGASSNPVISPDGRFVAFVSLATNLVSNVTVDGITPQVYLYDSCGGTTSTGTGGCIPSTSLISSMDGIEQGNGPSSSPAVSNLGEFVAFVSTATNLGPGAPGSSTIPQIFLHTSCSQLASACAIANILASSSDGLTTGNGASGEPSITSDGRFIAFSSQATNLIPGDGPVEQIYLQDTCTGQTTTCVTPKLTLVSTRDGSTPANNASGHPSINTLNTTTTSGTTPDNFVVIVFSSKASNLAANSASGVQNIFARNTCLPVPTTTTVSCNPSTALASQPGGNAPQPANGDSFVPVISKSGHAVAFISFATNLVPNDNNGVEDLFLGTTTF